VTYPEKQTDFLDRGLSGAHDLPFVGAISAAVPLSSLPFIVEGCEARLRKNRQFLAKPVRVWYNFSERSTGGLAFPRRRGGFDVKDGK
jgi:hypothetical protein